MRNIIYEQQNMTSPLPLVNVDQPKEENTDYFWLTFKTAQH